MYIGRPNIISHLVYSILASLIIFSIISLPVLSVENAMKEPDNNMHMISVEIPQNEQMVYPGMIIHPIITIRTALGENDIGTQVLFSAHIGPYDLIQNNTYLNVSDGEYSEYHVPFMVPYIQPGIYQLTISGQGKIAGEDTNIWMEQQRLKTPVEVIRPKPSTGIKMCNCK